MEDTKSNNTTSTTNTTNTTINNQQSITSKIDIQSWLLELGIPQDVSRTIETILKTQGYQTIEDLQKDPPKSVEQLVLIQIPLRWANKIMDNLPHHAPSVESSRPLKKQRLLSTLETDSKSLFDFVQNYRKTQFTPQPTFHILSSEALSFHLVGRQEALKVVATVYQTMYNRQRYPSKTAQDRTQYPIPVCSGIPGLGKTRMLEEWPEILKLSGIETSHTIGVVLPYFNGWSITQEEHSLPIETSFCWRLLYRFFLSVDSKVSFEDWFKPLKEQDVCLQLRHILTTIQKYCGKNPPENQPLIVFIGVDEYQAIKDINQPPKSKLFGANLLTDLLEVFLKIIDDPIPGLVFLPLMSGTDLESISIVASSRTDTVRVPMRLLTSNEVEDTVASISNGPQLLQSNTVRRHLFYFGGNPRCIVEYTLQVMKNLSNSNVIDYTQLEKAYNEVRTTRVSLLYSSISKTESLILVAWSLSCCQVSLSDTPFRDNRKWSRLRDTSLCLIGDDHRIQVPYSLMKYCSLFDSSQFEEPAKSLIECLHWLSTKVDDTIYDLPPWYLWELFGACYHALRINSLLFIGKKVVPFSTICSGACVNGCDEEVILRPVTLFRTMDKMNVDLPPVISMYNCPEKTTNWIEGEKNVVVINGENGKGVDIFFSLKRFSGNGYVVCNDQRKRVAQELHVGEAKKLLELENILPKCFGNDSVLYRGLFSIYPNFRSQSSSLPLDTFLMSYSTASTYHGSLCSHPGASPFINTNYDNMSTIKLVLKGSQHDVSTCAKNIVERRESKLFENIQDLGEFVGRFSCALKDEERILF